MNATRVSVLVITALPLLCCDHGEPPLAPTFATYIMGRGPTEDGAFQPAYTATTVLVTSNRSEYDDEVLTAVAAWNAAWAASDSAPEFSMSSGVDTLDVVFDGEEQRFCGHSGIGSGEVTITLVRTPGQCAAHYVGPSLLVQRVGGSRRPESPATAGRRGVRRLSRTMPFHRLRRQARASARRVN
jgi:hypothetical protein